MRDSYMSSSLSTEKAGVAAYTKNLTEFMKGGVSQSKDDDDDEESSSLSKSAGDGLGSITQMYEKYKKMQELLQKYNAGDFEESATISKSQ